MARTGTGITKRHCQCKKTCTKNGRRVCPKTCSHSDRYRVRKEMNGQRQSRHFTSYDDAQRWAAEQTLEQRIDRVTEMVRQGGERTFAEVAEMFLAKCRAKVGKGRLKSRTYSGHRGTITKHLLPVFGNTTIDQISIDDVQDLVDAWEVDVAPQTVHNRFTTLRKVLKAGGMTVSQGDNPGEVELVRRGTVKPRVYLETKAELQTLIDAIDDPYKMVVEFAALVGTRTPGETFELRVSDIINGSRVSVSRAWDKGTGEVGSTKTHQQRIVGVPKALLDKVKASLPANAGQGTLLFTDNGERINYDRFKHAFDIAVRALPEDKQALSPYGLRHTAASLLANAGVPIWQVSNQLGHKSTAVTESTYAHLFGTGVDATASALDEFVT